MKIKPHPHSDAAWRKAIERGRREDNAKARRDGFTWLVLSILLSVGAVTSVSSVLRDGAQMQGCDNGELQMPAWERGLDGVLQPRGIYCYRPREDELKSFWTIGEDGAPAAAGGHHGTSDD
jgi:hypothetical protein